MNLLTNRDKEIIEYLFAAERDAREVSKVTDKFPELTIEDAYLIQDGLLARKGRFHCRMYMSLSKKWNAVSIHLD